ncbi:MAG: hypothetical protein L6R36_003188 [Xanthoria steineri]|nr:MAG: hypothetical protein L6R36_003188 [Xanthoria steineri]
MTDRMFPNYDKYMRDVQETISFSRNYLQPSSEAHSTAVEDRQLQKYLRLSTTTLETQNIWYTYTLLSAQPKFVTHYCDVEQPSDIPGAPAHSNQHHAARPRPIVVPNI